MQFSQGSKGGPRGQKPSPTVPWKNVTLNYWPSEYMIRSRLPSWHQYPKKNLHLTIGPQIKWSDPGLSLVSVRLSASIGSEIWCLPYAGFFIRFSWKFSCLIIYICIFFFLSDNQYNMDLWLTYWKLFHLPLKYVGIHLYILNPNDYISKSNMFI